MPTIEETIAFIQIAHAGQMDKSGKPYYEHPIAVMGRLPEYATESERIAALLHDVVEDTSHTRESLTELGYSDEVLDIVELVTLDDDKSIPYPTKIKAIIDSGNVSAMRVKFADMSENSSEARLRLLPEERQTELRNKYRIPLQMLAVALEKLDPEFAAAFPQRAHGR